MRDLPKAELHVHLEGTASPDLIRLLAQRNKVTLPGDLFDAHGDFSFKTFDDFLRTYDAAASAICTPQDYRDVTYQYLIASAEQGVIYTELTASNDHAALVGISDVDHLDAIAQGIDDARAASGIEARIIMTCVRNFGVEQAEAVAKRTVAIAHPYVTGFGMAGNESDYPAHLFTKTFATVAEAGLGITVHAGEWAGPESIRLALDLPGPVTRIGHGVRAVEDPDLLAELADKQIVLEVCPGSNVALGLYPDISHHPFQKLRQAGIPVTLNSDDPPYFKTTISEEYANAAQAFDLTDTDLLQITQTAIDSAFVEPEIKRALSENVRTYSTTGCHQ